VNERTVVGGVDWPLCVPPTVERDRHACSWWGWTFILILVFLCIFVFELGARVYGADRQAGKTPYWTYGRITRVHMHNINS